jgi:hypothetical protein
MGRLLSLRPSSSLVKKFFAASNPHPNEVNLSTLEIDIIFVRVCLTGQNELTRLLTQKWTFVKTSKKSFCSVRKKGLFGS